MYLKGNVFSFVPLRDHSVTNSVMRKLLRLSHELLQSGRDEAQTKLVSTQVHVGIANSVVSQLSFLTDYHWFCSNTKNCKV